MASEIEIHGSCEARFAPVREAFAKNFREQGEVGAALAVAIDGALVVDLWAGHKDHARQQPWQRDTLVNVYSTTKGVTALAAHRLVDEGKLDLDAPVAKYWPEFAQAGKGAIPVRWLLSHRAGLPAVRKLLPNEALYDWTAMTDALAAETPWWTPGSAHGYHAVTFGWLVGEVVRRIAGKSLGAYVRDTFAKPLGLDFHIGLAEREHARVADILQPAVPDTTGEAAQMFLRALAEPEGVTARAFMNPPSMAFGPNAPAWRSAEIPGANGHGTARALATLYGRAALGDGAVISRAAGERCRGEQSHGDDLVLGVRTRFGLGFMLRQESHEGGRCLGAGAFGHPGAGGSLAFADPEARLGFGYVMNRMGPRILLDDRAIALVEAMNGCLGGEDMSVRIEVGYEGDLHTTATHGPSGAVLETDAPKDNEGKGETFSPTDLLATALGTCMLTVMGILARRKGWDMTGARASVDKNMVADPVRRVGHLVVRFELPAGIPEEARKPLERAAYTCPVHQSLHPDVKIETSFVWT